MAERLTKMEKMDIYNLICSKIDELYKELDPDNPENNKSTEYNIKSWNETLKKIPKWA